MVDLAAKWNKMLYEEAREQIGNVAVPHETIQTLIKEGTKTPNIVEVKGSYAIPKTFTETKVMGVELGVGGAAVNTALNFWEMALTPTFISREQGMRAAADVMPYKITERTVTAPELKPTWTFENLKTFFGNIKIPTVNYGGDTYKEDGVTYQDVTPQDFTTNITDIPFSDFTQDIIDVVKQSSPEMENYMTETTINFPEIPDIFGGIFGGLKDVGKWLIIGALALGGIYIAGKYLGRPKK